MVCLLHVFHVNNYSLSYYLSRISSTNNAEKMKRWLKKLPVVWTLGRPSEFLFTLDGAVNVTDKEQWSAESYCSQHKEKPIANASHISKEEWGLHEPWHIWSSIVVIQAVGIYEQASWPTTEEWPISNITEMEVVNNQITRTYTEIEPPRSCYDSRMTGRTKQRWMPISQTHKTLPTPIYHNDMVAKRFQLAK